MARKVVWTESAWNDLEGVANFISRDSPYYAGALVREASKGLGSDFYVSTFL